MGVSGGTCGQRLGLGVMLSHINVSSISSPAQVLESFVQASVLDNNKKGIGKNGLVVSLATWEL